MKVGRKKEEEEKVRKDVNDFINKLVEAKLATR